MVFGIHVRNDVEFLNDAKHVYWHNLISMPINMFPFKRDWTYVNIMLDGGDDIEIFLVGFAE